MSGPVWLLLGMIIGGGIVYLVVTIVVNESYEPPGTDDEATERETERDDGG